MKTENGKDSKTVLFADDSPSVRFLVRTTLAPAGYTLLEVVDGQQALDILSTDQRVDILLTDLHMPLVDGIELVKRTRAMPARRYLPIVMLTTESQTDRVREGQSAGLTAWIVKPFNGEALLKIMTKVLGKIGS